MKKVYLAGPTVFFKDSLSYFDTLKNLCAQYGLEPLVPFESDNDEPLASVEIFKKNIEKIHQSSVVLADLNPFRSEAFEPDSGTVFEIGYAFGIHKKIVGVVHDTRPLKDKLTVSLGSHFESDKYFDNKYNLLVEDFGHPLNLMLAHSSMLFDSYQKALEHISKN